jgi:hypothetical protein
MKLNFKKNRILKGKIEKELKKKKWKEEQPKKKTWATHLNLLSRSWDKDNLIKWKPKKITKFIFQSHDPS